MAQGSVSARTPGKLHTDKLYPGKLRITFILPLFSLNGGIRVVAQYMHALRALGHQVHVVVRRTPRPRWRDVLRGRAPFQLRPDAPRDFFVGLEDCISGFPTWRAMRPSDLPDADFLVCTWWETVEWALPMPSAKGRLVHLMQGYEMWPYLPLDRVAATYRADTCKIAVSQWVADQVLTHHGRQSAAVIHNAVDLDHFSFCPQPVNPQPVNPQPACPKPVNPVLTLGFMYSPADIKNPGLPFALADHLAARGCKVRLVSLGSLPLPPEHASRSDLSFHYRPDQADIPAIYQRCDLWLFPSFEEGFGLPLLEALACGTPVVSGRAGAAPQLVKSGHNGYLTDPDVPSFAAAVQAYAQLDRPARQAMRAAARQTVEGWTWQAAAQAFVTALPATSSECSTA